MAKRKNTAPKARVSRSPGLYDILGHLSDSRAILECAYTALEETEPGDPAVCLRHGLDLLRSAYTALDSALTDMGNADA